MTTLMMVMTSCQKDKNVAATGISMSQTGTVTLVVGETLELTATIQPANATSKEIVWMTNNPGVATAVGGVVTAILPGTAKIVATTTDGAQSASINVTVTNPLTGIAFSQKNVTVGIGEIRTLPFGFIPHSAIMSNRAVTWATSNPAVLAINATTGEVTGIDLGNATVTVTYVANSALKDVCNVTVVLPSVKEVKLDKDMLSLPLHKTATLAYTVLPVNAENKAVTWSSNKPEVATVDPATGLITAVSIGTAIITVTTVDGGYTAKCTVTVPTNLLVNPSFEDPDDGSNNITDGWVFVTKTWFASYYDWVGQGRPTGVQGWPTDNPEAAPIARRPKTNSDIQTGNGSFFINKITGNYCAWIGNNATCGMYQIVDVTPGAKYSVKVDFGFNSTAAAQSRPMQMIKILSVDGNDFMPNVNVPITMDPPFTSGTATNPSTRIVTITGIITVPAGINRVRFQLDQVTDYAPTNIRTPITLIDGCEFAVAP